MLKSYSQGFYSSVGKRAENSAEEILGILMRYIEVSKLSNVVDLGCGAGAWTEKLLNKTKSKVSCLDLKESIDICQSKFGMSSTERLSYYSIDFELEELPPISTDLVLNLEVLEHLSLESGLKLISWMSQHSSYVLFSAATPGQGGTGHINERPHEFWLKVFRNQGFVACDIIRPLIQGSSECARYYQLNVFLLVNMRLVSTEVERNKWESLAMRDNHEVRDYRSYMEKFQFGVIRLLPSKFVTLLSKFFSH